MTAQAPIGLATCDLVVDGISCAGCIAKLERGLSELPGMASARVNFTSKQLTARHDARLSEETIIAAVQRLGFQAYPLAETPVSSAQRESRRLARSLAVAAFAAMNVMLLSVSVWSGADGATRALFHWLSALIALPAVAYAGRPFFESAWRAVRQARTNMDVPITIGVLLTCAMSLYETITHGAHAYFDGAVMLLAFLLAGRLLDTAMRERAQDGVAALLRSLPDELRIVVANGSVRRIARAAVVPGMSVLVAAGDRIGIDGTILDGVSDIDRSLVTGESTPEHVESGSEVLAGTLNLTSPLTIRATTTAANTVVADIARLMEAAGQGKSRYVRIADRASRLYAPVVHCLAALSFVGWMVAGAGWHEALLVAVAVLIITCPCALGLAVPVSQVVAAGALMRSGVLVRDGGALERLALVDEVLLDKTGTVTLGRLVPVSGMPDDEVERSALLALAQASRHPISQAIAAVLESEGVQPAHLTGLREEAGQGVSAMVDGRRVALGRASWIAADAPSSDTDEVSTCFAFDGRASQRIVLSDALRDDAAEAINRLKTLGLRPQFISGDAWPVVSAMCHRLGLTGRARLSPAAKHEAVERLEIAGRRVLMVGDGLNDGPALKRASVGMAPAAASDVGRQTADLIFFGDRLAPVPVAILAARRTMRVVRQNFVLAIGYNVLAVPLAVAGLVTPLIAALAMSGSSILVVANALRLVRSAR